MLSNYSDEIRVSRNGVLIWKIDNYSKIYNDSLNYDGQLRINSDAFYTEDGYKMRACLYPNGAYTAGGLENEKMSLYFQILKSDNIDDLEWPFNHKVTMTLIDQEYSGCDYTRSLGKPNNPGAFMKPAVGDNCPVGSDEFFRVSCLLEAPYMKDDSIIIKVVVAKPANACPRR